MFARILQFVGAGRLATSGVALSGDDPQPVEHPLRETLDSRYHRMRAAMAADDEGAIREVLAADFVSHNIRGGRSNAGAMIRGLRTRNIGSIRRTAKTTLTAIDLRGDEAVVEQRYTMTSDDPDPRIPRALWTQSTDVWRNEDGIWRLAITRTMQMEAVHSDGRRITQRRV